MLSNDSSDNVDVMLHNPKKALIKMSIPLIVSLLISSFYNLIDAAWVSGLGADALAGVGFFTPVFMVLVGFGNGLGAGAAFAISKLEMVLVQVPLLQFQNIWAKKIRRKRIMHQCIQYFWIS